MSSVRLCADAAATQQTQRQLFAHSHNYQTTGGCLMALYAFVNICYVRVAAVTVAVAVARQSGTFGFFSDKAAKRHPWTTVSRTNNVKNNETL